MDEQEKKWWMEEIGKNPDKTIPIDYTAVEVVYAYDETPYTFYYFEGKQINTEEEYKLLLIKQRLKQDK